MWIWAASHGTSLPFNQIKSDFPNAAMFPPVSRVVEICRNPMFCDMRKVWLAALFVVGLARTGFSQTLRGTVVMDAGRPASGVVVTLVDAGSKEVGRALTNELGEYRLTAPRP